MKSFQVFSISIGNHLAKNCRSNLIYWTSNCVQWENSYTDYKAIPLYLTSVALAYVLFFTD